MVTRVRIIEMPRQIRVVGMGMGNRYFTSCRDGISQWEEPSTGSYDCGTIAG